MCQECNFPGSPDVLKTKRLESATIEEIAEKSGFGKSTPYYYFQSKEEVFSAVIENGWKMELKQDNFLI